MSEDAAAAMLEELLILLSLLSISSIASCSISSTVRSSKEVKIGTQTSAQCGVGGRADSISEKYHSFDRSNSYILWLLADSNALNRIKFL